MFKKIFIPGSSRIASANLFSISADTVVAYAIYIDHSISRLNAVCSEKYRRRPYFRLG
jgi:hypothetical protein